MSPTPGAKPSRPGITVPFDGIPLHAHREWFARFRELGYTDIWSAEVDGADGFTPLALAAAWEPELNLGVAITPAYTRGPALLAQSLAAMADAAPGRFACGLGASSRVIVADWNGMLFENQYRRVRDTLRFLRMAFSGEKVTEEFGTFNVKGFRLARIPEQLPPIYLAALRPGMLHLAGKEADGAILNWLGAEDVATSVAEVAKAAEGAPREIVARIFVIVTEDTRHCPDDRTAHDHRLSQRRGLRRSSNAGSAGVPHCSRCGTRGQPATARRRLRPSPTRWWTSWWCTARWTSAGPTYSVTSTTASPSRLPPSSPSGSTWPRQSPVSPRRPRRAGGQRRMGQSRMGQSRMGQGEGGAAT